MHYIDINVVLHITCRRDQLDQRHPQQPRQNCGARSSRIAQDSVWRGSPQRRSVERLADICLAGRGRYCPLALNPNGDLVGTFLEAGVTCTPHACVFDLQQASCQWHAWHG